MKFFRFSVTLIVVLLVACFLIFSINRFKSIASEKAKDVRKENAIAYDEFSLSHKMVEEYGNTYLATGELLLVDNQPVEDLPYSLSQSLGNIFSYIDPTTNVNSLDETVFGQVQMYTSGFHKEDKSGDYYGNDAVLTIDSRYQSKLFELLDGTAGQGVILNYKTGDILASVSASKKYSLYDCIDSSNYEFDEAGNVMYNYDSWNSLTHYPIYPGSTIKPLLALAILNTDDKKDLLEYTYQCNLGTSILDSQGQYSVMCYDGIGHNSISLKQAISKSCNKFLLSYCYTSNISKKEVIRNLELMGIGGTNDHHLTSFFMRTGNYCLDEDYSFHMAAIGEADCKVPLLAIATAYCGIANNGVVAKPRYVKAYMEKEEMLSLEVQEHRITTEENAIILSDFLRETTVSGTASQLSYLNDSLQLSCKTGSAEYSAENTHKLCVSYSNNEEFPYLIAVDISQLQGYALDISASMWEYILQKGN